MNAILNTCRILMVAVLLAVSGVARAQFADDASAYYYYAETGNTSGTPALRIFNFDGQRACLLNEVPSTGGAAKQYYSADQVRGLLRGNADFLVAQMWELGYRLRYQTSSMGVAYVYTYERPAPRAVSTRDVETSVDTYLFSPDREQLTMTHRVSSRSSFGRITIRKFRRIDRL